MLDKLTRPFLLAGGISAHNRGDYEKLAAHPLFWGVDVDTNARGTDGKISEDNVAAIARVWKEPSDA
jgi:phosphoribosylanthranilate isomerase